MARPLTDYADCAGCASKLDAAILSDFMRDLPPETDGRVLVDFRTGDDAGVYRWSGGPALVQTVDFFTPIVDDPYVFGQIAAVNALSDVYAMGGIPRTALAITALPKNGPTADQVRAIFRGGADTLKSAGVALLGGHTVTDPEIKFGYAITGEVDPAAVWTNATARPGDTLILTKRLGTGILVRARKYGRASDQDLVGAVASMVVLNDRAAARARRLPPGAVSACTDVTGFGLVGHATEMASANGTTLVFEASTLPALPGALGFAREFLPCGGRANARHFGAFAVDAGVPEEVRLLCLDPQTAGGLLLAVGPGSAAAFLSDTAREGGEAWAVGRVESRREGGPAVALLP
jgi:selenide,water dikinase